MKSSTIKVSFGVNPACGALLGLPRPASAFAACPKVGGVGELMSCLWRYLCFDTALPRNQINNNKN